MRKWLWAAVMVMAMPLVMAGSCGASTGGAPAGSSPAASAAPVAVGTAMKASSGEQVTVVSFKRDFSTGNEFDTPKAGNEYVQVTYSLVNGSNTEWSLPLFELKLIDSNGQKYDMTIVTSGEDSVDSLAAGGHVAAAHLVYEIPKGIVVNVAWQPDLFSNTVLETKLA